LVFLIFGVLIPLSQKEMVRLELIFITFVFGFTKPDVSKSINFKQ
jgi:hypothetical protein